MDLNDQWVLKLDIVIMVSRENRVDLVYSISKGFGSKSLVCWLI